MKKERKKITLNQANELIKKMRLKQLKCEALKNQLKRSQLKIPPVLYGLKILLVPEKQIAEYMEVSQSHFNNWMNGHRKPEPFQIIVLSNVLSLIIPNQYDDEELTKESDLITRFAVACYDLQHDLIQEFPTSDKWKAHEFLDRKMVKNSQWELDVKTLEFKYNDEQMKSDDSDHDVDDEWTS